MTITVSPVIRRRCLSAPPHCVWDHARHFDASVFALNKDPPFLQVDFPLTVYRNVFDIFAGQPHVQARKRVIVLDKLHVLKLKHRLVDVDAIVANMRLAATVIPAPRVHKYGYSGNCSYVLMDYIPGHKLCDLVDGGSWQGHGVLAMIEPQIALIVKRLALVGLAHNALHPSNIIVDEQWNITGVVDWDHSSALHHSSEYQRYISGCDSSSLKKPPSPWQDIFLRHCDDRLDTMNTIDEEHPWKFRPHAPRRGLDQPCVVHSELVPPCWSESLYHKQFPAPHRLALVLSDTNHWHVLSSILDASELGSWKNICICSIISASPLPEKISKRIPAHVIVRIAEPFAIEDLTCRTVLLRRLVPLRPHVLYMIGQFSTAFRSTARALFCTCHSVKGTIRTQILQLSPPRELPIDDTSSTIVSSSDSGKRAHCMKLQVSLVRLNYSPPSRMTIWHRNLNVRGERSPKRVKHAFRYLESTAAPEAIERFLQAWLGDDEQQSKPIHP